MSEKKKEIVAPEFNAGFEVTKNGNEVECVYKDENVFKDGLPISQASLKDFNEYNKQFTTGFVKAACEDSKKLFKKDKEVENASYSVGNGLFKNDNLIVKITKKTESKINFGERKGETVVSPRVSVVYEKQSGMPSGETIKEFKSDLKQYLQDNNLI